MTRRMLFALLALVGVFVSLYLTLYKAGLIGSLACAVGSCEKVQSSRWALFLGLPVAAWGLGFYLVALGLAIAGLQDRFAESRGITIALAVLTGWGVVFSGWLTWLELFVIEAICQWCVVSAVIVLVMFVLALLDLRPEARGPAPAGDLLEEPASR